MAYVVRVVCRQEAALGFGLAGLPVHRASTPREGAELVLELAGRGETGVLLVEDVLYEALPASARRSLERRPVPMTIPFPGPSWAAGEEETEAYLVDVLRRAIGYRVRLR
jgi:vacuolar-type H+-ATPase subunit F/Vma7